MATSAKPIRRVVTGNDQQGRSRVMWDGAAPNVRIPSAGANPVVDLWIWNKSSAPLGGDHDDGNLPYDFPGPRGGGHLRIVQQPGGRPAGYDPAKDARFMVAHPPKERPEGRTWDRGDRNVYTSDMHKTETVDYAILLEGQRDLVLDDVGAISTRPGDMIIQVGAYHQWTSPREGGIMLYDMIAARFVDGPVGLAQGNDPVLSADRNRKLPDGVKPVRRIVTIDKEAGKGCLVTEGPSPDVRFDPARPGFASTRLWVTDGTPAKIVFETLHLPHTIEPPAGGSVLRVVTVPPDANWKGKVGAPEVHAFFRAMGSPAASTYSPQAPHPYMQKTRTLDFCIVQEGEVVLVLDAQEVRLKAGDIVIQRGTNHAWSNRTNNPAVIAIASHDGTW